jgi:uncharacterized membrane protein
MEQYNSGNRYISKARVEALSDGVFAIAMTILVFNIKTPLSNHVLSESGVLGILKSQWAYFASYFISFTVLGMFWTTHNAFLHFFSRNVNRMLVQLNMLYLMFVVFIPFSAYFLGAYEYSHVAVLVYGINIIIVGLINYAMFAYALYSHDIDTSHVDPAIISQSRIRVLLTPLFALLGIIASIASTEYAQLFFAFPVIFNIVPRSLLVTERLVGINLKDD